MYYLIYQLIHSWHLLENEITSIKDLKPVKLSWYDYITRAYSNSTSDTPQDQSLIAKHFFFFFLERYVLGNGDSQKLSIDVCAKDIIFYYFFEFFKHILITNIFCIYSTFIFTYNFFSEWMKIVIWLWKIEFSFTCKLMLKFKRINCIKKIKHVLTRDEWHSDFNPIFISCQRMDNFPTINGATHSN